MKRMSFEKLAWLSTLILGLAGLLNVLIQSGCDSQNSASTQPQPQTTTLENVRVIRVGTVPEDGGDCYLQFHYLLYLKNGLIVTGKSNDFPQLPGLRDGDVLEKLVYENYRQSGYYWKLRGDADLHKIVELKIMFE